LGFCGGDPAEALRDKERKKEIKRSQVEEK